MSSSTASLSTRRAARDHAWLALTCALLGGPGSTLAWNLPAGGFWIGMPLAACAIAFGLRSRPSIDGTGSRLALAAIVLASVEVLFTAAWTVLG